MQEVNMRDQDHRDDAWTDGDLLLVVPANEDEDEDDEVDEDEGDENDGEEDEDEGDGGEPS